MNYQRNTALTHTASFRFCSVLPFPPSLPCTTAISNIQSLTASFASLAPKVLDKNRYLLVSISLRLISFHTPERFLVRFVHSRPHKKLFILSRNEICRKAGFVEVFETRANEIVLHLP